MAKRSNKRKKLSSTQRSRLFKVWINAVAKFGPVIDISDSVDKWTYEDGLLERLYPLFRINVGRALGCEVYIQWHMLSKRNYRKCHVYKKGKLSTFICTLNLDEPLEIIEEDPYG